MYKAKSFILKAVMGSMAVSSMAVLAIACIPASKETKSQNSDVELQNTNNQDTSIFADTVQDGQILQCFCWSYNEIMEYLPKIASQGFTAIQTSPVQVCKEATAGKNAKGSWWAYYQPAAFTVDDTGDNALGTPEEFQAMCEMAHSYGVKVLVDVVANHLGNQWVADSLCERSYYYEWEIAGMDKPASEGGYIPYTGEYWQFPNGEDSTVKKIDTYYYKDTMKFHPYLIQDNDEPGNVTQGNIGMMDLDTSSSVVQNAVADYLEELINYGVDGFRFDAAKHIEPQWDSISSDFWPNVMARANAAAAAKGKDVYAYGEILNRPGIGRSLSWYTNNGVAITDSGMGHNIVENGGSGHSSFNGADGNNYADYRTQMVTWAESHDNYMGTQDTHNKSEAIINRSYAILASRKDFATLYCARFEDYENSMLGDVACLNGWSYREIGAVNKFHNFFAKLGANENCYDSNGYTVTERFVDAYSQNNGIVIVGNSGNVNISTSHLSDGVYYDQVTGNQFTVSNGTIRGTVDTCGIAVIYNQAPVNYPSITASLASGMIYSDTLNVTYTFKNAISATVMVGSDKASATATSSTISLSGIEEGQTVTVVITLNGVDGSVVTKTYTYTRFSSLGVVSLYFNNNQNWSKVNAYAWNETTHKSNSNWPGVELTTTAMDQDGNTCYVYNFDMDQYDHIIFNDGSNQTVDITVNGSKEYTLGDFYNNKYNVNESTFVQYTDPVDPVETITVDFKNDQNWSQVYVYLWRGGYNNGWPGVEATLLGKDVDGFTAYSITVDLTEYDMIIFNNGHGAKTEDLSLDATTTGFDLAGNAYDYSPYTGPEDPVDPDPVDPDPVDPIDTNTIRVYYKNDDNWSTVYAYIWNNGTKVSQATWPGTPIESAGTDKDGYHTYYVDVDLDQFDRIIFNNTETQTGDFVLTESTTGFTKSGDSYVFEAQPIDPDTTQITVYFKNTASWDNVYVYLWRGDNNNNWPGVQINQVGVDGEYKVYAVTVDLTRYNMIIFNNGNGDQTDDFQLTYQTTGFTANGSAYNPSF